MVALTASSTWIIRKIEDECHACPIRLACELMHELSGLPASHEHSGGIIHAMASFMGQGRAAINARLKNLNIIFANGQITLRGRQRVLSATLTIL